MYEQNQTAKSLSTERNPVLPAISGRITKLNDEQGDLLNQIEEKLHNVLNKKEPVGEMSAEKRQDNDFVSSAESQLSRLSQSNRRLEKVLSHLNEII